MANSKLVRDGKAMYKTDAIRTFGIDIVERVKPIQIWKSGWKDRMVQIYLISDLEAIKCLI